MTHFCYDFSAATHIGGREENQDHFFADARPGFKTGGAAHAMSGCCRDRPCAFAVFDGMGGMEGGRVASALAEQVFRAKYEKLIAAPEMAAAWLNEVASTAHDLITARLGGRGGTTLTAGVLYRDQLMVYNVGDSPAYLIRKEAVTELSYKDNKAQLLRDQGYEPAPEDEFVLTRSIGCGWQGPEQAHLQRAVFQPGDRLVLCTDGAMNGRTPEQLKELLDSGDAEALVRPRKEDPIGDNATAVVLERIR